MVEKNKYLNYRNLFYIAFVLLYLIPVVIIFYHGYRDYFQLFRRLAGLTGLSSLFIAIILSSFVKQSKAIFGVVYLKIHHFFSILGLVLISLHPLIMMVDFGTTRILIPNFSSWNAFITNGGRFAIYIIYIAALAAVLKKKIIKYWKSIHTLLYPAFLLSAIHGIYQGSDLRNPILYYLLLTMIILVVINFLFKKNLLKNKIQ